MEGTLGKRKSPSREESKRGLIRILVCMVGTGVSKKIGKTRAGKKVGKSKA